MTLDERILAYLDGSATPAEAAELDRVLHADRAARDRFARLCEQDAALRQMLSCAETPAPRKPRRRPAATGPTPPWAAIAFAAAALLFILILAAALSSNDSPPPRAPQYARPPRPLPVALPEPTPKPEPPPSVEPPKPPSPAPKRVEPNNDFVLPAREPHKPEPRPDPAPPKVEPQPPPPPPPTPAPKGTEAVVIVARIERLKGEVMVLTGTELVPAKEGAALAAGQGVQTVGADSSVQLRMDTTVLEVGGDTRISQIMNGTGKLVQLDLGSISAQVSRQPAGQPLVFVTPHAEARVLGTKLALTAGTAETRLEVREGRVRFMRLSDKSSVEVAAGQFAVTSDVVKPAARKIPPPSRALLADDFDDDTRWSRLEGGFPTTVKGTVEIDLSPRPDDPYPTTWHASGGLRTRQSFTAPFRVSVDVEISHKHDSVNTLLVLTPKTPGPRTGKNEIGLRLRDGEYSVIVETVHGPAANTPGGAPIRERWTVEFGLKEVSLAVNGKPVLRHVHGLAITQEYFVELQGTAKRDAPSGARVRFDNLKIEP